MATFLTKWLLISLTNLVRSIIRKYHVSWGRQPCMFSVNCCEISSKCWERIEVEASVHHVHHTTPLFSQLCRNNSLFKQTRNSVEIRRATAHNGSLYREMANWAISHPRDFRFVGTVFTGGAHPELVVRHRLASHCTDRNLCLATREKTWKR